MFEYLIHDFNNQINQMIEALFNIKIEKKIHLEKADNIAAKNVDFTLKAGFILSKQLSKSPQEISQVISVELAKKPFIETVEAVKGYINIRLSKKALIDAINQILHTDKYGSSKVNQDKKVIFDYASINPTGPMHAGHLRSAIIADSIINVFDYLGFYTCRQYYLNDTGGQIRKLLEAVFASYLELFDLNTQDNIEQYNGEYIKEIAKFIASQDGDKWCKLTLENTQLYKHFREIAVEMILDDIKKDLKALNIIHDQYYSEYEMELNGKVDEMFNWLQSKGYVEEGEMPDPIKHVYDKNENKHVVKQLKMNKLDDKVKALTKKDGTHTYLLADIALHSERYKAGFDQIVDFFGADHADHAQVLETVMKELYQDKKINIKTCQMVRFEKDGQEFKMSKRAGTYVTARDIIESVGADAIRMEMCSRTANAQLCLDVDKILIADDNNPIFYIQYAFARCCSAINKNMDQNVFSKLSKKDLDIKSLENHLENDIIREIIVQGMLFTIHLEKVVSNLEIHSLFIYALDLAKLLHNLWNEGKKQEDLRLSDNLLYIAQIMQILLGNIMKLFGITPMMRMN